MGAAVIILLILAGVAVAAPGATSKPPGGTSGKGEGPPSSFPAGAKIVKDRWWGPFRLVVFQMGEDFGWIVEYHRVAMDEWGEDVAQSVKIEQGFDTEHLAESSAIMFIQNQPIEVQEHHGLLVFPLVDHVREDGKVYQSFMAQRGGGEPVLVATLFHPEIVLREWKTFTRAGWPAKDQEGEVTDDHVWGAVSEVV